jgi:hypothetical protein
MTPPPQHAAKDEVHSSPHEQSRLLKVEELSELSPHAAMHEGRNFGILAVHQILVRVGWIFKTESVIMPAFLDAITPNESIRGALRGCLPVLNRFGQSIPPVLRASKLESLPRKKWVLFNWSLLMSGPFLILAGLWQWFGASRSAWLPVAFLFLYAVFFGYTGLNQLAMGTVQGKLIGVTRRGRLMGVSTFVGAVLAIGSAYWLLGDWLSRPDGGYGLIFGFTGLLFVAASACIGLLSEEAGVIAAARESSRHGLTEAWRVVAKDANFRQLAIVVMLFSGQQLLFPHYQALAREKLQLKGADQMWWVVTQNAATGLGGLVLGWLADRRGNRLTLSLALFSCAVAPLLAIGLAHVDLAWGRRAFWMVFLPMGLTPLVQRTLANYALEISLPEDHPRYLSTLNLCLAVPFLFSPLVGFLADVTSFEAVFLGCACLILLGGVWSFRLIEPRHQRLAPTPGEIGGTW